MPFCQEPVNVILCVLPTVLMYCKSASPKSHGRNTIILRNHYVSGSAKVDERKVHSIRSRTDDFDLTVIGGQNMIRVAKQNNGDAI